MKIVVAGTGYVGLVAGVCFAEKGHNVICVDTDEQKVKLMESGISPIYEKDLQELMQKNYAEGRLHYTTDYAAAYKNPDDIMFSLAFPDIVDIHDIRVRELAGRARFPLKAQQRHRIIGKITAQDLDGHDPVQDGVHRLIHICHAALSDTFKELITISDQLIHRPHPPPSALPRP